MPFGAFCPMPLRLSPEPESGWSATQHARAAADVAAIKRTVALAVMTVDADSGAGQANLVAFVCRAEVGVASSYKPSLALNGTGDVTITLAKAWVDEFGSETPNNTRNFKACRAEATGGGKVAVEFVAPNAIRVRAQNAAGAPVDGKITIAIYGASDAASAYGQKSEVGLYGGAPDKHNVRTEVVPYAWGWYRTIQGARGSAYTTQRGTLVHAENLAVARSEAARTRAAERMTCNAQPSTSDERLGYWATALAVHARDDEPLWALRLRCAAKYQAVLGPTTSNIDAAVGTLLGTAYVKSWRQVGSSLASPPTQTFWPVISPGPAAYDLGGGTWLSERANLVVEVQRPAGMTQDGFAYLVNVQLFGLLDRLMPAHATFNWGIGVTTGFVLDVSQLDYNAVT